MDEYTKDICDDLREEMEAGKELPAVRRFVTCSFQGMRAVLGEIDRLQALANDYAHEASANALKLPSWRIVANEMPDNGRKVWLRFTNRAGNGRTVFGYHLAARTREASGGDFEDNDEALDYDEARDTYYWPAGWYESCENSEMDYVMEHDPTHWMPLPEPPK